MTVRGKDHDHEHEKEDERFLGARVGRTPLVRSPVLERMSGHNGRIFLKLEGNNPSGHREDRMAYLIIRDALARGKRTICMGTYGTVGGSLAFLSKFFDVQCVFYVPSKAKLARPELLKQDNIRTIEHGKTYEDCVEESRRVSRENGWYDANPGLENNLTNMYSFSYMARELHMQMDGPIAGVFCQTSNGSSISGLHMGFKQLWVQEEIDSLPRIFAVSTDGGNAIVESFRRGSFDIMDLDPSGIRKTRYNRQMACWRCFNGQDALNALHDTGGKAVGVSDGELVEYGRTFRKEANIRLSIPNAYPAAALVKVAREGLLGDGDHVVILNDGTLDVDIREVGRDELTMPYRDFLTSLDEWLIDFTDPLEEMEEAVENAFDKGHVLCAFYRGELVGIVILSRSAYDTFFPKFHLSYIATRKTIKGRGIATQLMEKAIEVSGGDLSLHVETDNRRAIKFYEKMGWQRKYYRMLYKGPVV